MNLLKCLMAVGARGDLPPLPPITALKVCVRYFATFTHGDKPAVAIGDAVDVAIEPKVRT